MSKLPEFVPGLALARDFYLEVLGPLLRSELPDLEYSAALLGPGSYVPGYDTARSRDHDWATPEVECSGGHHEEATGSRSAVETCSFSVRSRKTTRPSSVS